MNYHVRWHTQTRTSILCLTGWSTWGVWGECSVTSCNTKGISHRFRRCNSNTCPGPQTNQKECRNVCGKYLKAGSGQFYIFRNDGNRYLLLKNTTSALRYYSLCFINVSITFIIHYALSLIMEWLTWGSWSNCSVSCGVGSKKRIRRCNGKNCNGATGKMLACGLSEHGVR